MLNRTNTNRSTKAIGPISLLRFSLEHSRTLELTIRSPRSASPSSGCLVTIGKDRNVVIKGLYINYVEDVMNVVREGMGQQNTEYTLLTTYPEEAVKKVVK